MHTLHSIISNIFMFAIEENFNMPKRKWEEDDEQQQEEFEDGFEELDEEQYTSNEDEDEENEWEEWEEIVKEKWEEWEEDEEDPWMEEKLTPVRLTLRKKFIVYFLRMISWTLLSHFFSSGSITNLLSLSNWTYGDKVLYPIGKLLGKLRCDPIAIKDS